MSRDLILIGMGNTLLGDDGVGIFVVNELEKLVGKQEGIDFECVSWGGFRMLDVMQNYKTAIIVDAITTRQKPEGFIHITDNNNFLNSIRMVSYHDINFASAVDFARKLSIPVPDKFFVYGVEVRNTESFSENMSPSVHQAAKKCIKIILNKIYEICPKIIIKEEVL